VGYLFFGVDQPDWDRQYGDWEMLKRLWHYMKSRWLLLTKIVALILVNSVVVLLAPFAVATAIDNLTKNKSVLVPAAIYLVLNVLSWIINYFIQTWSVDLRVDIIMDIRLDAFDNLQRQDLKFYDDRRTGRILSRVMNDSFELGTLIALTSQLAGSTFIIVGSFIVLLSLNVPLALVALAIIPLIVITALSFRKIARSTVAEQRKSVAAVNTSFQESIAGVNVSKSFAKEKKTFEDFREVNDDNYRKGMRRAFVFVSIFPIIDLIATLGIAAILFYGGNLATSSDSGMTVGMLYLFILYLQRFFLPVIQLSTFYNQFQGGLAAWERILGVMDVEPQVREKRDAIELAKGDWTGGIAFQNVSFEYTPGEPVFDNFSLDIQPGENIAIVGHTGAGKTSLTSILARFYEIQAGKILLDGEIDIKDINLRSWRRGIGIVLQDPFLFSGTIRDNITYGECGSCSDEDFRNAAAAVQIHEWIESLPDGYNTEVGERGRRLSLGQKQLVSFARALLSDPRLLILDEATASVDAYTESLIQDALRTLFAGRTSIVIAHRLSTVKNADRIIVLDQGRIIEEGSHEKLLERGGKYADLYQTYFEHQEILFKV
jgi:ABC-type multidrug transport system fused ATPase/permease subunit